MVTIELPWNQLTASPLYERMNGSEIDKFSCLGYKIFHTLATKATEEKYVDLAVEH